MKTAFTTFAIVSLVAVSSASADHKHENRPARPIDLAHALHVQAESLEREIEHHYPNGHGTQHRTYIISRLAVSTERELSHGHTLAARRNLASLHQTLHEVDNFLRQSIANGRPDGVHVRKSVREMDQLIGTLERSLRFTDVGHHNHNHYGNSRLGGRRVEHDDQGHRGQGDHDGHDHGGRGRFRSNDRVVSGPGVIYINRGGLSFGIRTR